MWADTCSCFSQNVYVSICCVHHLHPKGLDRKETVAYYRENHWCMAYSIQSLQQSEAVTMHTKFYAFILIVKQFVSTGWEHRSWFRNKQEIFRGAFSCFAVSAELYISCKTLQLQMLRHQCHRISTQNWSTQKWSTQNWSKTPWIKFNQGRYFFQTAAALK